jgi:hypothetical protein
MTRIEKVDVMGGKAEMGLLAVMEIEPVPRNWLEKVVVLDCVRRPLGNV